MITRPCNVCPLTPHFYLVKLGFKGVFIFFFLFLFALKHRLWVLVRITSLRRFLTCTHNQCLSKNKKKASHFVICKLFFYSHEKSQYITWACFRNDLFLSSLRLGCSIHLSNVLTDHLNILVYIKAWFLPNNKIKLLLLYYTMT